MTSAPKLRPRALTIVAWYLIVMGGVSLVSALGGASPSVRAAWAEAGANPMAIVLSALVSGLGYLAAGIGVLRGQRWGRTLYLGVGALAVLTAAFVHQTEGGGVLLAAAVYGLIASMLFRPESRAYFDGAYEPAPEQAAANRALHSVQVAERNPSDLKRAIGVLVAVGAALLMTAALTGAAMIGGRDGFGVAGVIALLTLPVLALAAKLWGVARWAGVAGWTLLGSGVYAVASGLVGGAASQSDEWEAALEQLGPTAEMLRPGGFTNLAILGLIVALVGLALIARQRERDRHVVDEDS